MSQKTVAIIDDEEKMTKLLKLVLEEDLGVTAETYNDPIEGLAALSKRKYDLISLDHKMPGMTGASIVAELRKNNGPNKNTPVLIFSGFMEEVKQADIEHYSHVLFLSKPIDNDSYVRNAKMALEMANSPQN